MDRFFDLSGWLLRADYLQLGFKAPQPRQQMPFTEERVYRGVDS
jgi:hypothetical protein